jgi:hypothetical protein
LLSCLIPLCWILGLASLHFHPRSCPSSTGRAIRHANDYAVLILVDKRYAQPSIRNKLPKWIGEDVKVCHTFGESVKSVVGFFKGKRVSGGAGGGLVSSLVV